MIISASRRTDIPALYAEWFVNRLRAGYCSVPNPFNTQQIARVSLAPEDVDVIVFWTRNPRPLIPYLGELDARGYLYYFQYTLMGNPRLLDPWSPPVDEGIAVFRQLARQVGPQRMIWRYDPIVFTRVTPAGFHNQVYAKIATALRGSTHRCVISLMDEYSKARRRLRALSDEGAELLPFDGTERWFAELLRQMVAVAYANDMGIFSCAEDVDLGVYGVQPGKCVDDGYIRAVFNLDVSPVKDPGQRKLCGCVHSKDIGMYDSCTFGCRYCYAVNSFARARDNFREHDPRSPSLLGWYDFKKGGTE